MKRKPSLVPVVEIPRPYKQRKSNLHVSHSESHSRPVSRVEIRPHSYPLKHDTLVSPVIFEPTDEVPESRSPLLEVINDFSTTEIPVYLLSNFTIYNSINHHLVPFNELINLEDSKTGMKFGASGLASPWMEEFGYDSSSESESELELTAVNLKLSSICELSLHYFDEEKRSLDGKIYIRTRYAWYILDEPSALYKAFYVGFLIQQRSFHIVMQSILQSKNVTYDSLIAKLIALNDDDLGVTPAHTILGHSLTAEHLSSPEVIAYFTERLPGVGAEIGISLSKIPIIKVIMGSIPVVAETAQKALSQSKSSDISVSGVTVTPIVSRIASTLFKGLEVVGTSGFNANEVGIAEKMKNEIQEHRNNPKNIHWGRQINEGLNHFYDSVQMDGIWYQIGDVVMVNPGDDEDAERAESDNSSPSKSANSYANLCWFATICYFFENGKEKMCHVQWFIAGSKTVLQETAHSRSLFFTDDCDNIPIASIFRLCNLRMLRDDEEEPPDDKDPTGSDFHCGLMCIDHADFLHLPREEEIALLLSSLPPHKPCYACGVKAKNEFVHQLRCIPDGFTQHGYDYHIHDCVFIHPRDDTLLLDIAQIIKISGIPNDPKITVRELVRYDEYVSKYSGFTRDERRLVVGNSIRTITPNQLDGICFVQCIHDDEEIERWVHEDYHFYTKHMLNEDGELDKCKNFDYCLLCYNQEAERIKHEEILKLRHRPLRGLELFSGAGGLGTGMNMSGFVETKYAVEFSEAAASTYQRNHPDTTMYCQDTCVLLKHAIETSEGKNPNPLLSNDGKTFCPPMPEKGEVDFIFGGPPCQSFSGFNHNRRADDPRASLPANMLSYVEHYDCERFLLENVIGILHFPLRAKHSKTNIRTLEGGVRFGVVKFILRTLIALGHQVRFCNVQAGHYGVPQSRNRVIFWGAKRGVPLPNFPVPLYTFPTPTKLWTLPTGKKTIRLTRSRDPDNIHWYAPFKLINVNEAIGDLPPFDWKSPHCYIPATDDDKREVIDRARRGIPPFNAVAGVPGETMQPGYVYGAEYATPPQNSYQRWIRQGMWDENGNAKLVHGHYTRMFKDKIIEATVRLPLRAGADCKDLPDILCGEGIRRRRDLGFYARLDGEGEFRCAITVPVPNMKRVSIIHPSQKRMITIRESARAQGFPDHYMFEDTPQSTAVTLQMRQIGNAVPVPLALALGKELGRR
ncbi:S-adenosyl-L-methionine-dependent methyltransferase [Cyathus striatus]|nr:S-adenosyl-L-methionine-dependent methyltransferase [Cyathus striatus]